jgi:multidrug efflux pump subunit AcrB
VMRGPANERNDPATFRIVRVFSPVAQHYIPLSQVVMNVATVSENYRVRRRNRLPTITVKADGKNVEASVAFEKLRPAVEKRFEELKKEWHLTDYSLEWGGEYEDSGRARAGIAQSLPFFVLLMIFIVIALFSTVLQPLIIWLTVPLGLIGVTFGLLVSGQPFGFMATLGFLSLMGMLIKNSIVLIDEINAQMATGKDPFLAVLDSGVSRVRPVSMAAFTTVLGMIPLLVDAFFVAMAVTIMVGLTFASVLTLIVVPVLYVTLYRIPIPVRGKRI